MSNTIQTLPYHSARPNLIGVARPTYRLHTAQGILLAAFFGTPLAGGVLLGQNYKALGRSSDAVTAVLIGFALTAGLIALSFALPANAPTLPMGAAVLAVLATVLRKVHAPDLDKHVAAGGAVRSNWVGVGVGVASLAGLFAVIWTALTVLG